jgi:hypothetical protein
MRLAAFATRDMEGQPLTDADVRAMAPVLLVLLRGFA